MRTTLNDFKSYEPIEFGKLESSKTTFSQSNEGIELEQSILNHLQKMNDYLVIGSNSTGNAKFYMDLSEKEKNIADELSSQRLKKIESFKGEACWKMKHSFRARNAGGNYGIHNAYYTFDYDITIILHSTLD